MKRSDMLDKMYPLYARHIENHGCVIVDILMLEILCEIEDAGMIPPLGEIKPGLYKFSWELEDEQDS